MRVEPKWSVTTSNCVLVTRLKNYLSDKAGKDDIVTFATWSCIDFLYDFRDDVLKQCKTGMRIAPPFVVR